MPEKIKEKTVTYRKVSGRRNGARKPKPKTKIITIHKKKKPTHRNRSKAIGSAYAKVLCSPFTSTPVRLGGTGVGTSLFTVRSRMLVSLASSGLTGAQYLLSPYIGGGISNNVAAASAYGGWSAAGTVYTPALSTIASTYGAARPIAGAIKLRLIQNSTNDQGLMYGWLAPTNFNLANVTPGQVANFNGAKVVQARDGIQVRWLPQDTTEFEFTNTFVTGSFAPNANTYATPLIYAAVDSTANSAMIEVESVFHYEGTILAAYEGLIDTECGKGSSNQLEQVLTGITSMKLHESVAAALTVAEKGLDFAQWMRQDFWGRREL